MVKELYVSWSIVVREHRHSVQSQSDPPPQMDVALTLRSCGCGYMIVLAMYLNTLLMISVNLKLGIFVRHEEDLQPLIESEKEKKEELALEKKEEEMPFLKYAEAPTQEELKIEV
ncbi:unnamed protein product [Cylicostephanus goldi]|uniref:Uncharacterized protein n=1 Tax=Cylicostephanus goldi TaxID=71465 RepID=A0A3P6U8P4_CYLGO|nr:unnamed protein product [Cylicostephanus goldi]